VFSTKARQKCLTQDRREDVFRYIWGIIKNKKCHLYRINGMEDHIHILTSLHPTICLSDLVKDIKVSSSKWIKDNGVFSNFTYWQDGYGAFTDNNKEKERLIEYIKNQETHHRKVSFIDEYKALLLEAGIEFDEKYLV
jgi:REP element-mobilizing transposase RayT